MARALELTYTNWSLKPFAEDLGWFGPPFRWDEDRRFLVRCELDAAFFHIYFPAEENGSWQLAEDESQEHYSQLRASFPSPRHAVAYILDTFPIVRKRDEENFNGDYRTKRVILEIYDAIAESIWTNRPYQSPLDPPLIRLTCNLPMWKPGHPRPSNWPRHIHPPMGCEG